MIEAIRIKHQQRWSGFLEVQQDRLSLDRGLVVEGSLSRMVGLTLEAVGVRAAIGAQCEGWSTPTARPLVPRWSASAATPSI